jgi:hypothetical protein
VTRENQERAVEGDSRLERSVRGLGCRPCPLMRTGYSCEDARGVVRTAHPSSDSIVVGWRRHAAPMLPCGEGIVTRHGSYSHSHDVLRAVPKGQAMPASRWRPAQY